MVDNTPNEDLLPLSLHLPSLLFPCIRDTSQDSSIMGKAFHFNNCFVDILANAFCLPLFSSLPFLLSSFKMTGDRAFSLVKELRETVQFRLCLEERTKA